MFGKLRTIRLKLLFSFLLFLGLTVLVILTDAWFRNTEKKIFEGINSIKNIQLSFNTAKRLELTYFKDETINEQYYKTGKSDILDQRKKELSKIDQELDKLSYNSTIRSQRVSDIITSVKSQFKEKYDEIFKQLEQFIKERGFKDYGVEGRMRDLIHAIENSNGNFSKESLLMIRRHEKDFIIRKQKEYLTKLTNEVTSFRKSIAGQKGLIDLLDQYEKTFVKVVELEEKIGFDNNRGLKRDLYFVSDQIEKEIDELDEMTRIRVANLRYQNNAIQFAILALCIIIFVFLTVTISRDIGRPISKLSGSIRGVIDSKFSENVKAAEITSMDEIGDLSQSVNYMIKTVHNYINELRDKNKEIEKKQQALLESVMYAERIQKSLLLEQEISSCFEKYFVIYIPKYEVSGDFYWVKKIENKYFCAVLDCKGIGLSGAIMTMIVNTLLNQIILNDKIYHPSLILEALDREMRTAVPQGYMKICLCVIEDHQEKANFKKISFAGAGLPLYYSKGLELMTIEGSNKIIGQNRPQDRSGKFENQQFEAHESELIYLTTDGYVHQIDPEDIETSFQTFRTLIRENIHHHIQAQEETLRKTLDVYTKDKPQKDDITIVGIKLHLKEANKEVQVLKPEKSKAI